MSLYATQALLVRRLMRSSSFKSRGAKHSKSREYFTPALATFVGFVTFLEEISETQVSFFWACGKSVSAVKLRHRFQLTDCSYRAPDRAVRGLSNLSVPLRHEGIRCFDCVQPPRVFPPMLATSQQF